ncbi:MAG: helix-turn-helix domain-containing protein [Nanoarchaeota archaeon]
MISREIIKQATEIDNMSIGYPLDFFEDLADFEESIFESNKGKKGSKDTKSPKQNEEDRSLEGIINNRSVNLVQRLLSTLTSTLNDSNKTLSNGFSEEVRRRSTKAVRTLFDELLKNYGMRGVVGILTRPIKSIQLNPLIIEFDARDYRGSPIEVYRRHKRVYGLMSRSELGDYDEGLYLALRRYKQIDSAIPEKRNARGSHWKRLTENQKKKIIETLKANNWNITMTASQLHHFHGTVRKYGKSSWLEEVAKNTTMVRGWLEELAQKHGIKIRLPNRPIISVQLEPELKIVFGYRRYNGNPISVFMEYPEIYEGMSRTEFSKFDSSLYTALLKYEQMDLAFPPDRLNEIERKKLMERKDKIQRRSESIKTRKKQRLIEYVTAHPNAGKQDVISAGLEWELDSIYNYNMSRLREEAGLVRNGYVPPAEARRILKVSKKRTSQLGKEGTIENYMLGGIRYFSLEGIERYKKRRYQLSPEEINRRKEKREQEKKRCRQKIIEYFQANPNAEKEDRIRDGVYSDIRSVFGNKYRINEARRLAGIIDGDDISTAETTAILGLSKTHIHYLRRNGELKGRKVGRDYFYDSEDVKRFKEERAARKAQVVAA